MEQSTHTATVKRSESLRKRRLEARNSFTSSELTVPAKQRESDNESDRLADESRLGFRPVSGILQINIIALSVMIVFLYVFLFSVTFLFPHARVVVGLLLVAIVKSTLLCYVYIYIHV